MTVSAQFAHQIGYARHGLAERGDICDLRANMHADPAYFEITRPGCISVERPRVANGHTEFMLAQSRRNIGMSFGGDVGIHSQRDRRSLAHAAGALRQRPQLRLALDVEKHDSCLQGRGQFLARFAYAREYDSLRGLTFRSEYSFQFATRDHVESASLPGQHSKNAQVGICFHGVADCVGQVTKRCVERVVPLADHGRRVDIERRAVLLGQFGQGDAFAVQDKLSAAAKDTAFRLAIDESGGTRYGLLTTRGHFFFGGVCGPPRTRMATTVCSSKVCPPAACSAAALKSESTTQVAAFPSHS